MLHTGWDLLHVKYYYATKSKESVTHVSQFPELPSRSSPSCTGPFFCLFCTVGSMWDYIRCRPWVFCGLTVKWGQLKMTAHWLKPKPRACKSEKQQKGRTPFSWGWPGTCLVAGLGDRGLTQRISCANRPVLETAERSALVSSWECTKWWWSRRRHGLCRTTAGQLQSRMLGRDAKGPYTEAVWSDLTLQSGVEGKMRREEPGNRGD